MVLSRLFAITLFIVVISNQNIYGQNVNTTQNENNLTKFSCILVKSIAYGVQEAIKEYSLLQEDLTLSKAIETAEITHYLSEYCPEKPETSKNDVNKNKEHESKASKKEKHNNHNQHNFLQLEKTIIETNASLNNTNNAKNTTKKAENLSKPQNNEFERFLRSFTELTEILKNTLVKNKEKHVVHEEKPLFPENANKYNVKDENSTKTGNKSDETPNQKSRHSHSHKKHKYTRSKSQNKERTEGEFPENVKNNLKIDQNVSEHLKSEEKQQKTQQQNKKQLKHKDSQNMNGTNNENNEKYIYLVPENRNKRSISKFSKQETKNLKINKKRNNDTFKSNKKVKNLQKKSKSKNYKLKK